MISNVTITKPIQFALEKIPTDIIEKLVVEDFSPELAKQSYSRCCKDDKIYIKSADEAGLMYALLDLAELAKNGCKITDTTVSPYLDKRGIKFNIPLDSRTPSYSDASTSATKNVKNMWDITFWHTFLDRMAEEKYNVISIWTLAPFPSLVKIPEFPDASIDDVKVTTKPYHATLIGENMYSEDHRKSLITVKKITIEEKMDFWREVMQYGKDRCIDFYIFTWNLFTFGTEDSNYGITDDIANPITKKYVYAGVKALLDTYPLLAGIGVTSGEKMSNGPSVPADQHEIATTNDIHFIADTYGKAIADYLQQHSDRKIKLIHRLQYAKYHLIKDIYKDFTGDFEFSFKYSQAHMYASTTPHFIDDFLENNKQNNVKFWLTVRNDDYYMYRWGNVDFARDYLKNMPVENMSGFYMGPDGFTWGRDYMTVGDCEHPLVFDKMWYMFKLWGQLAYNINKADDDFVRSISQKFNLTFEQANDVCIAWKEASSIIPDFNCMHWHHFDFQWYPEGCCMYLNNRWEDKKYFADINEFMECDSLPKSGYISVKDYAKSVCDNSQLNGISPVTVIDSIHKHCQKAMTKIVKASKYSTDIEFVRTCKDIELMCILGQYFAIKERAAINLSIYTINKNIDLKNQAISLLETAATIWKTYSEEVTKNYIPQVLTRIADKVDLRDFDEIVDLDILLAKEK